MAGEGWLWIQQAPLRCVSDANSMDVFCRVLADPCRGSGRRNQEPLLAFAESQKKEEKRKEKKLLGPAVFLGCILVKALNQQSSKEWGRLLEG